MNARIVLPSLEAKKVEEIRSKKRSFSELEGSGKQADRVIPGQIICPDSGFLKGHGVVVKNGNLVAATCGIVERVNKLVSVRPLKSRYNGDVGDVVVGRITEVSNKRWSVDLNARQNGILLLSAVNLPGVQRRKTHSDALQMRSVFAENDLISAEVQAFYHDGSMAIHTRSFKYRKLTNGQLVQVRPSLIRRSKSHFHTFPFNIDIILGCNGYIWLCQSLGENEEEVINEAEKQRVRAEMAVNPTTRLAIARVAQSIRVLEALSIPIAPKSIQDVYEASITMKIEPKHMMQSAETMEQLVVLARE